MWTWPEVGASIGGWWVADGWPWLSAWLQTPGFGGTAAVLAAVIAFAGVRRQTRLNAWWQRAEWALDLLTRAESTDNDRDLALEAITALQGSRLAKKDEQTFLRGVADYLLDPLGDGTETDDVPALAAGLAQIGDAPEDTARARGLRGILDALRPRRARKGAEDD